MQRNDKKINILLLNEIIIKTYLLETLLKEGLLKNMTRNKVFKTEATTKIPAKIMITNIRPTRAAEKSLEVVFETSRVAEVASSISKISVVSNSDWTGVPVMFHISEIRISDSELIFVIDMFFIIISSY